MKRLAAALAAVAIGVAALAAQTLTPHELEQQLRQRWVGKAFTLRGFPVEDRFATDASGHSLQPLTAGPWSLSRIEIKNIKVSSDHLEIAGERVADVYDPKSKRWHYLRAPEVLHEIAVTVRTDPAALNPAGVAALESGLFILSDAELAAAAPPYWRSFILGTDGQGRTVQLSPDTKKNGLQRARVLSAPMPKYAGVARQMRIQGTVKISAIINADGSLGSLAIVQPLGAGLDEAAVDTVRMWRYAPATLNGIPSSIDTVITIRFTLSGGFP